MYQVLLAAFGLGRCWGRLGKKVRLLDSLPGHDCLCSYSCGPAAVQPLANPSVFTEAVDLWRRFPKLNSCHLRADWASGNRWAWTKVCDTAQSGTAGEVREFVNFVSLPLIYLIHLCVWLVLPVHVRLLCLVCLRLPPHLLLLLRFFAVVAHARSSPMHDAHNSWSDMGRVQGPT